MNNAITDVDGIKVGHYTDLEAATGCTVVLAEEGATAGVDIRGSAPGTRETALLAPTCLVEQVHAVLLTGGSAFGLDAAGGVMRYLAERGRGFDMAVAKVPIVTAAVLFDLTIGRPDVRPDAAAGYAACQAATSGPVAEGSVGAGTGATVGKVLGPQLATKSGLASLSEDLGGGIVVGVIVAVNAAGDVVDPASNEIVAGPRNPRGPGFISSVELVKSALRTAAGPSNTTIGVVATNASLSKVQANKVAQMAQDGLALAIRPVHTMMDGDTVFALATGTAGRNVDVNVIGTVAVQLMARAIVRAARQATGLAGVPAAADLKSS